MITQDIIERVRAETDIVGFIGEYIKLKRSGKSFVGLCPFHQEKTPSFNVSPDRQAYYCFGCGAGGNVITFLMNYENVSFPEAVKRLAERLGIKIQYTAEDDPAEPLFNALDLVQKIYKDTLWSPQGSDAQRYLASRGLKKETVNEFDLGLVPQSPSPILSAAREAKLSTQVLKDSGVLASTAGRLYPFLAGRIVFPIRSASGRLVGFSGRVWGDDPNPAKYVNTPETKLFKKSWLLYGLPQARAYLRREGALLVEGQMDVLRLAQEGFRNVVAPLGTAFTTQQAKVLSRYTDKVILIFDGDEPGRKAALRALGEVLAVDLDTRLLLLPEEEDPDSYLSSHPPDDFKSLLERSEEPMPFVYSLGSPSTTAERKKTAELMLSLIKRVPDPLRRELYLDEAANLLRITRRVLTNLVKPPEEAGAPKRTLASYSDPEERLLRRMVRNTELIALAVQYLDPALFPEGEKRELLERLYELSGRRGSFKISEILDLLPDGIRSRVLEWSFLDEHTSSREEFARTLADYLFKHQYRSLRRDLKDAERSGDIERSRRIMAQLVELESKKDKIYQEI